MINLIINLIIYLYTKPKSTSKSAAAGLPAFSNLFLASLNIYQKVMSITKYVQKIILIYYYIYVFFPYFISLSSTRYVS